MHFYSHSQFFDAHTHLYIFVFDVCKQSWTNQKEKSENVKWKIFRFCLGGWWMNHNKTTGKTFNGIFRLVRCFNRFHSSFFHFFHFDFGLLRKINLSMQWEWKIEKRREKTHNKNAYTTQTHTCNTKRIKFVGSWKLKLLQIVYPHLDLPNALELSVTATQCLHKLNGRNWCVFVCVHAAAHSDIIQNGGKKRELK